LGFQALQANTTASNNTAVGYQAGYSNTTGTENQAFGAYALDANTTGNSNSAFGLNSLGANTTASNNAAYGVNSLRFNTTGAQNTAVGADALQSNTTASNNTAVGYQAGVQNTTGLENTYLGYRAGYTPTSSYNTFIGSQAGRDTTTGATNTFIGAGSGYQITTGNKNTILGPYNGNQGGLDIRTASNYIVLSDGDGNAGAWFKAGATLSDAYMGLTSGRIEFPATQNPSSNANTLDDYEEGTWTPAVNLLGTITYGSATGRYVKVGSVVTIWATLICSSTNTTQDGTAFQITGLPFACGGVDCPGPIMITEGAIGTTSSGGHAFGPYLTAGQSVLNVFDSSYNTLIAGKSQYSVLTRTIYNGGTIYFQFQMSYRTA
jgi:hypothetical protein